MPGFGWIEDHGGGNVGTFAADMYKNGNKIGVMGSGTTVGNPGDELTGNKVGQMGGTTVGGKGDINKQVGIMGDEKHPPSETTPPALGQMEPVDGEIHIVFVEVPEKNSTPPPYKPDTTPLKNP